MSFISPPIIDEYEVLAADEMYAPARQASWISIFARKFCRQPFALIGLLFLLTLSVMAIIGPALTPKVSFVTFDFGNQGLYAYGPNLASFPARIFGFTPPVIGSGSPHSIFIDTMLGARVALLVGVLSSLLAMIVGTVLGSISGYAGGWLDSLVMRFTDILLSLPFLPLTIGIILTIGQRLSVPAMIMLFGVIGWPDMARLVRATMLTLRERDFVEAAYAVGVPARRIIFRHLLPHIFPTIIVVTILNATQFILAEATIEYIHLNQSGIISLGGSISYGQSYIESLWWWATFPGICLVMIVLALHLVGEGVREALDVRVHAR